MKSNTFFHNILKPLLTVFLLAVFGLLVHKGVFCFFVPKETENHFVYQITTLYAIFTAFSFVIVLILLMIKQKNFDIVGYGFLILTMLKMMVAYVVLKPILSENLSVSATEKASLFMIFAYFLAIETIVTIRILNDKP